MGLNGGGRLLIVSHRLPVTLRPGNGGVELTDSAGGLATGLRGLHAGSDGLWFGYPGDLEALEPEERAGATRELEGRRLIPVPLSAAEVAAYYENFANRVLWPLFHYLPDRLPPEPCDFAAYARVNERFAERVAERWRPGDVVWVHDYHLLLLPRLLRERLPGARIGFFLHIPFPAAELFRALPGRDALLHGLLGADLVGFHSHDYVHHLRAALLDVLGLEADLDRVRYEGRVVRLGAFAMGVDAPALEALSRDRAVGRRAAAIRGEALGRRIILGIDRLDYTKGIVRRLLAFERLLRDGPTERQRLRLIQVAVPSREEIPDYQRHRAEVEALVGRINGEYGTVDGAPVHYLHQGLRLPELLALYRAAHVMLVTPVRDGMNLVAKEFVAARTDEEGVLVLSEFAGAAAELGEALAVNPYDVDGLAAVLRRALALPLRERRARMRALRRRVRASDVHQWARAFLATLEEPERGPVAAPSADAGFWAPREDRREIVSRLRRARTRLLLLDYDGTLVSHAVDSAATAPDAELLALLRELAAREGTGVHLVSGRPRPTLEAWFGELDITLWAEHGFWRRQRPGHPWKARFAPPLGWEERILPILEEFSQRTPGARVEIKDASLMWHYAAADPEQGDRQARRLRAYLGEALHNQPVEVLPAHRAVEVRLHGVSKGRVATRLPPPEPGRVEILAVGDDTSDEELFASLPPGSLTLHVGPSPSRADYRLPDAAAVRDLLRELTRDPLARPLADTAAAAKQSAR